MTITSWQQVLQQEQRFAPGGSGGAGAPAAGAPAVAGAAAPATGAVVSSCFNTRVKYTGCNRNSW